jgi:hypothetical protein
VPKISKEFQEILTIAASVPGYNYFNHRKGAYALIGANKVVDYHEVEGVHIEAYETEDGVRAVIEVEEGTRLTDPVIEENRAARSLIFLSFLWGRRSHPEPSSFSSERLFNKASAFLIRGARFRSSWKVVTPDVRCSPNAAP